jgi:hypothetical protein
MNAGHRIAEHDGNGNSTDAAKNGFYVWSVAVVGSSRHFCSIICKEYKLTDKKSTDRVQEWNRTEIFPEGRRPEPIKTRMLSGANHQFFHNGGGAEMGRRDSFDHLPPPGSLYLSLNDLLRQERSDGTDHMLVVQPYLTKNGSKSSIGYRTQFLVMSPQLLAQNLLIM